MLVPSSSPSASAIANVASPSAGAAHLAQCWRGFRRTSGLGEALLRPAPSPIGRFSPGPWYFCSLVQSFFAQHFQALVLGRVRNPLPAPDLPQSVGGFPDIFCLVAARHIGL